MIAPPPSAIAAKLYEKRDLCFGHTSIALYETVVGFAPVGVAVTDSAATTAAIEEPLGAFTGQSPTPGPRR